MHSINLNRWLYAETILFQDAEGHRNILYEELKD